MQPSEQFTVTRRSLDVEDYIDILRRHKGWIFGPFLFTLVISVVGVYLWPDRYRSTATVQIRPQQIPEQMIPAAINTEIVDSINAMAGSILSRNTLTQIIRNFELYPKEQTQMTNEDVIELMKKDISIQPMATLTGTGAGGRFPAFSVSFTYQDRLAAQKVVQDLVGKFIEQNFTERGRRSFQTTEFIEQQALSAKQALDEASAKLTAFRVANNGRLPDQLTSNMQGLAATTNQSTMIQTNLSRAKQERASIETRIDIVRREMEARKQESVQVAQVQATTQNPRVVAAERDVEQLEVALALALQRGTDKHPDVINAQERLNLGKQRLATVKAEEAALAQAARDSEVPVAVNLGAQREIRSFEANLLELESQLEAKDAEIEAIQRSVDSTYRQLEQYSARVQSIPVGEQEYASLVREERMAQDLYLNFSQQLASVEVASEMEDRQQGESLALLDSASLPTDPIEPNRPLVIAVGAGFGFLLGLGFAQAREMKDTSLKNLKDVRAYTQMAILGSVPLLENDFVVRRRKRMAWLGWTTACLVSAITMAGSVAYYYTSLSS